MDKEQALRKIEELKEFVEKLDDKIDFSKWVGRDGDAIAIKGEKYLISYRDGDIFHMKTTSFRYDKSVNYEVITWGDLKPGDVFISHNTVGENLADFKIFVGKDNDGDVRVQYLKNDGVEYISTNYYSLSIEDRYVKRFLRQ